jgi:phospholipid/cholesterol/gamma-HCH transport system substrate-binding protein
VETKANHLLIGGFALVTTLLASFFVFWLSQARIDAEYAYYDVKFSDGISGLPQGGEVRYNGVKVGTVDKIRFDPLEPSTVFVTIKVENRPDFKLRQDSHVSLGLLGITGITYVLISGGSPDSPSLAAVKNRRHTLPVIDAKPSAIKRLLDDAPGLAMSSRQAIGRLGDLLSTDNQEKVSRILTNLDRLSANLADASVDLKAASKDAPALVHEIRGASKSVAELGNLAQAVVAENRSDIRTFSNRGLAQVDSFVAQARQLAASLDRIASRIESDPPGYILGGRAQGREVSVPK